MSCPGAARRVESASRFEAALTDQSFPRAARLTARRSFLQIYDRGQRVTGPYFVLFGRKGETSISRLGITASRKCGGAVQRNRLKRLVREIYRRAAPLGAPAIDLVVNVKPTAGGASHERLQADLVSRLAELRRRIEA